MAERDDNAAAFRDVVPVNRLSPEAQRRLWQATTVRTIGVGQPIYLFGANDGLLHYLLKGDLDFIEQGRFVQRLRGGARIARRPLDHASPKRYTARGYSVCTIASVAHTELEREAESTRLPGAPGELTVSDLAPHTEPVDSMTDIMRSALFQVLPADAIQRLFGTLDPLEVHAEDTILQQGEPGEYFYILARGHAEVTRRRGQGPTDIHVSDLRPGNTFGEAALLSGYPRDASVTMLTDGRVLRLAKAHFDELIRGRYCLGLGLRKR
ncbi:MAG: cyclic nucleotide-binding domain-containing protein [Gammaproteobacteria bacterium]|nr:cyclic nucleotide-binding domain-containing protein [Gammaproteobacteria bacterium]